MEDVVFEIDTELKERAEKLFSEYGLTLEEATILFAQLNTFSDK